MAQATHNFQAGLLRLQKRNLLVRLNYTAALSNCYLFDAGIDSKTAFRANTAAAISHLKDSTANDFSSIARGSMPKLSRVLSIQIAAASMTICPDEVPADVKELLNNST